MSFIIAFYLSGVLTNYGQSCNSIADCKSAMTNAWDAIERSASVNGDTLEYISSSIKQK